MSDTGPTGPTFTPDPGPPVGSAQDTGINLEGKTLEEQAAAIIQFNLNKGVGETTFLGVPEGFQVDFQRDLPSGTTSTQAFGGPLSFRADPSYRTGDEFARFSGRSAEYVAGVQDSLIAGGFLNGDDIKGYGLWGVKEVAAMKNVMKTANRSGRTWQQVIGKGLETAGNRDAPARPRVTVTNSDDLRSVFRSAAKSLTGGVFLPNAVIDGMVEQFQNLQRSSFGSGEAPPSASTFAEGQIDKADPQAIEANRFAQMSRVMTQLVGQV